MIDVVVVGGGPAGMMAAYAARQRGLYVRMLEQNEKLGKKLFLTGKGRCNITNACEAPVFFQNIVRNPKFLMSTFRKFSNHDLLDFFHAQGLETKTERGGRVFPVSDHSSDVIKALRYALQSNGVEVTLDAMVKSVQQADEGFLIATSSGEVRAKFIILATGGASYPSTGSTGDGYRWAEELGHRIIAPCPALVPLEDAHHICEKMQGLTLKNVRFTLFQNGRSVYTEQGELLFTHFGLSGPLALSASSYIDHEVGFDDVWGEIDLKPALSAEQLDKRLIRDFSERPNLQLKNSMNTLLPAKLIGPFLREAKLSGDLPANQLTKGQRHILEQWLKAFRIKIAGTRPIDEAVITAGGVDVKEISPATMESKVVPGLYFAGEVMDVSALTGGFNLQIAFSTGFVAGNSVLRAKQP